MKRFFREYGGVAVAVLGLLVLIFFVTPAGDMIQNFISDTISQTSTQSKVETNTQGSSEVSPSPGVTYTIGYELDGGKMSTKITSYSTLTETFELPTPYKTGYNFIGWTGSNGSTPETTVTIAKGSSGNRTYTANWRSNSTNVYIYNTKYISNSGVSLGTGTIEGTIGSTETVHAPKKDGYITPANQKVTFDNSNPKTVTFIYNPTLYAITYDLDGGIANSLKSAYTVETSDFTLPEPAKTGFTFKGWTGSNGSTPQKSVTVSKGSSGTKSYKANWEGITYTYVVAYRSTSGKSLGSTTVQGFLGDTKTVTLPAKTGYKTPDNLSVVFDTVGSKTVTVTYEPVNYNISFVKNGGTYSEPAIQYNIESNEIVLGNAHMAGTGFLGWFDNSSFSGNRILSIPTGSTGDKTFYAKFSVDSYSITYYLDEGTMSGGLTSYTVNTTTFNLPTPTKTGYTFKGWSGTGLSGNTMTVTIPQGSTGDREYKAHWEINEYTYTFKYLSSTGKQLGSTAITNQFQEGEMVTPPDYAGYTTPAKQSVIWDSTTPKTIDFTYPIINYNINYNLNGGTISGEKTTYTVEDNYMLPMPTRDGYKFEGWSTAKMPDVGEKIIISGRNYLVIEKIDTNIYKVMEADEYSGTVAWDSKGGLVYNNSSIDTFLNTTYYNSLPDEIKNAIIDSTITEAKYNLNVVGSPGDREIIKYTTIGGVTGWYYNIGTTDNPIWQYGREHNAISGGTVPFPYTESWEFVSESSSYTRKIYLPSVNELVQIVDFDNELSIYNFLVSINATNCNFWLRDTVPNYNNAFYIETSGRTLDKRLPEISDTNIRPVYMLDLSKTTSLYKAKDSIPVGSTGDISLIANWSVFSGFVGDEFYLNGSPVAEFVGYTFNEDRTIATKNGVSKEILLDVDTTINGAPQSAGKAGYEFDYYINNILVAENVQDFHVAHSLANNDTIKIVVKKFPSDKVPVQNVIEQKLYDIGIYDGSTTNGQCFDFRIYLKFVDA